MQSMPTKKVTINGNRYEITALKGRDAFELTRVLGNKLSGFASAFALQNPESLTQGVKDILSEDLYTFFEKSVNIELLKCNNEFVDDIDIHFACKPDEMLELLWEAVKFNCGGFTRFMAIFKSKMEMLNQLDPQSQNLSNSPEEIEKELEVVATRPRKVRK